MNDTSRLIGRVLVTGASGFVGRSLGKRMAADGWHVRGVVRSAEQMAKQTAGLKVFILRRFKDCDFILKFLTIGLILFNESAMNPVGMK